ncbi:unnamed protein product [Miscanthus lutarioriparius]|uniref:Uncharacterized protein n=1 Tax=Miscanthus lutarioriparius TaxID=422564 RepID=A0A811QT72_9POAL|nr:unnamed protein product [Miscanthus lutarioriparius]
MASFAAQLKDRFLGLVDRVTGWGGCGTGAGRDKDVPEATNVPNVQQVLLQNHLASQFLVDCYWYKRFCLGY